MTTIPDLLAARLHTDGPRPLLTWYDDASGERVELSVATAANWAAKTANLLLDEHGVEPGDPIRIDPADHWLSAVVALGAWTAGARIDLTGAGITLPGDDTATFTAAVLPQPDALLASPPPGDVPALTHAHREWTAGELADAAYEGARTHGLTAGCRVLSTIALDSIVGLDASLLLPLAVGGSIVFVAHVDEARLAGRVHQERVTHTAGVNVEGLPRLV